MIQREMNPVFKTDKTTGNTVKLTENKEGERAWEWLKD